jgi:hypothetical protein
MIIKEIHYMRMIATTALGIGSLVLLLACDPEATPSTQPARSDVPESGTRSAEPASGPPATSVAVGDPRTDPREWIEALLPGIQFTMLLMEQDDPFSALLRPDGVRVRGYGHIAYGDTRQEFPSAAPALPAPCEGPNCMDRYRSAIEDVGTDPDFVSAGEPLELVIALAVEGAATGTFVRNVETITPQSLDCFQMTNVTMVDIDLKGEMVELARFEKVHCRSGSQDR